MKDAAKNMTPAQLDALALGQGVFSEGSAALPTAAPQVVPTGAQPDALNRFIAPAASNAAPAVAPRAPVTGVGTAPSAQPFSIPSYEQLQGKRSEDYLKKLEGLTEKQRAGLADIKKQGGGEALMQLAAAVMGSPTLAQAAAKGLPMVASTAAATRKEARAVENMANDYDLNLAKAREAAARGDMESALMFKKLSDDAKYKNSELGLRAAMLNQLPDSVRTAMALQKDPSLAQFFPNMTKANLIPRDKALAQWEDLTRSKQQKYGDFETYFKTMNNQLLSDTIPGQGANIRPYS